MIARRLRRWAGRPGKGGAEPPEDPAAPEDRAELSILMVCMGNICRSPTAEGVLRAKLQQAGLDARVAIDSAGMIGTHAGEPPDARAIQHAARRGYDISGLRARAVVSGDFSRFHWLLAMDEANLSWLEERRPASEGPELGLLMAHARHHPGVHEVPDPYYGSAAGFERVLTMVEDACDGLVARVGAVLAARQAAGSGEGN